MQACCTGEQAARPERRASAQFGNSPASAPSSVPSAPSRAPRAPRARAPRAPRAPRAGFEPATYCLGGTPEGSPGGARCRLVWRLAAPIAAQRGLAWPGVCRRWLPGWLPATSLASLNVRILCPLRIGSVTAVHGRLITLRAEKFLRRERALSRLMSPDPVDRHGRSSCTRMIVLWVTTRAAVSSSNGSCGCTAAWGSIAWSSI
jgi:hypothetical protein